MGRQSAIINLILGLGPLLLGLVVATAIGLGKLTLLVAALVLAGASLASLLVLKMPALRAGHLVGFGPGQGSPSTRWLWWLAVGLLAFSVLLALVGVSTR